jgi:hypothetical protein
MNFIARSTLLSRIETVFVIKCASFSSGLASKGEVQISGSREEFIAATSSSSTSVTSIPTVTIVNPIAICTVVQPLQSSLTSQHKRCFMTLRSEIEIKSFWHSRVRLLLHRKNILPSIGSSSSTTTTSTTSSAVTPVVPPLPPPSLIPFAADGLMIVEKGLMTLLNAAKEEIKAQDAKRSSTTASLLPRNQVSEPILSISQLKKIDEEFINFVIGKPPAGL